MVLHLLPLGVLRLERGGGGGLHDVLDRGAAREVVDGEAEALHDRAVGDGLRRLLHRLVPVVRRVEVGEDADRRVAGDLVRVVALVLDGRHRRVRATGRRARSRSVAGLPVSRHQHRGRYGAVVQLGLWYARQGAATVAVEQRHVAEFFAKRGESGPAVRRQFVSYLECGRRPLHQVVEKLWGGGGGG